MQKDAGVGGVRFAAIKVREFRAELGLHRFKPGVGDFVIGPDNDGGDVGVVEKAERVGHVIAEEVVDLCLTSISFRGASGGFLRIGPAEVAAVFRESGKNRRLVPGVPRVSGKKGPAVEAFEDLLHLAFHGVFLEKVVTLEMENGWGPGGGVAEDRPGREANDPGDDHHCR